MEDDEVALTPAMGDSLVAVTPVTLSIQVSTTDSRKMANQTFLKENLAGIFVNTSPKQFC